MAEKQNVLRFFVPGQPKPAGSKSFKGMSKAGKAIITDSSKNKPWRDSVIASCIEARAEQPFNVIPSKAPIRLTLEFYVPRPKSHYRTGAHAGELKEWAKSARPCVKPDLLKLARCVEDALTGFAYHDDSDIVEEPLRKEFATPEQGKHMGVRILVEQIGQPQ